MEAILEVFEKITETFSQLSGLAREKTDAVRKDDLLALDEVLKKEQALSLSARSLERQRVEVLKKYNVSEVPLNRLVEHFPPEMQMEAKNTIERMEREFQLYKSASEAARDTLECNLHQIEKILEQAGVDPAEGPGYAPPDAQPPTAMRTDFHA